MTHTVRQVADRYGVRSHTVLHWIAAGDLTALNVGRSAAGGKPRWRITEAALEAFELTRTATPPAPRARRRRRREEVGQWY